MDQEITLWQTNTEIIALLGARVKTNRLMNNISQEKLAEETGLGKITIQNIESGKGSKLETFIRLLRYFGDLDKLDKILSIGFSPKEQYMNMNKKQRLRASRSC